MPAERLIVVGAGLSGLAVALGAAIRNVPVTVFEASGLVGGAAAYSGGQVWVGANHVYAREGGGDDLARTEAYVRGIAHGYPELLDEQAMRHWISAAPPAMRYWEDVGAVEWTIIRGLADYHADVPGAQPEGRYLTTAPVDGSRLGAWRAKLRESPYFRAGTTYEELVGEGRRHTVTGVAPSGDRLALGTGLVAGFLARLLAEPTADIELTTRVEGLLQNSAGEVVGVRASGPDGVVERQGTVVLATSTYDWDPELVMEFLGLDADQFGSMAPDTVRGDGVRLARSVGGATVRIPATCVPLVPGWISPVDGRYCNGPEYAMPHAMIVDPAGRRFCNDSYWVDIVGRALDPAAGHLPFYLIWDEQHRRKYGLGETPPGGEYPARLVTSARGLTELGTALGIDGDQLARTAEDFSRHAAAGVDPEFGRGSVEFINAFSGDPRHRPSPVLGPIDEPPYYGMRLILVGTAIGSSGVHADAHGRVLTDSGAPIPGLYAIGSCAAGTTFGSGYNSGMALSRGLTLAHTVAASVAERR